GAKLLVPAVGDPSGTVDAMLDASIAADCRTSLASGQSQLFTYTTPAGEWSVFIESFPPPPRLIIVGAVHTAIPLHRLAKQLGYHVVVVDARRALATPERFPEADVLRAEWPDDALRALGLDSSTAVVVLTHDPKFDEPALLVALASPAGYIGAIGSRTTNEERHASLEAAGVSAVDLDRIHAPIGLDIGARTPAEIALAILAEIVATRAGRPGGSLRDRSRVS
ncbi:MAG TPA: XdhC family protein, partial [Chloroflexia bacterium]|nr:XdhC family protein [Chloroflexia bacterium]